MDDGGYGGGGHGFVFFEVEGEVLVGGLSAGFIAHEGEARFLLVGVGGDGGIGPCAEGGSGAPMAGQGEGSGTAMASGDFLF